MPFMGNKKLRAYFATTTRRKRPIRETTGSMRGKLRGKIRPPFPYDVAAYEGSLKIMLGEDESIGFDIAADPLELSPIAREERTAAWDRLAEQALLYRFESAEPNPAEEIPADVAEGLRALGYLDE